MEGTSYVKTLPGVAKVDIPVRITQNWLWERGMCLGACEFFGRVFPNGCPADRQSLVEFAQRVTERAFVGYRSCGMGALATGLLNSTHQRIWIQKYRNWLDVQCQDRGCEEDEVPFNEKGVLLANLLADLLFGEEEKPPCATSSMSSERPWLSLPYFGWPQPASLTS